MREERFHNSKIHGVLDAFQNAGFHISSPKPAEVFRKRLVYTMSLLQNPTKRNELLLDTEPHMVENCLTYLSIVNREFSSEHSPLNRFLTACAHGDTRLSLDLFRSFLLSGYTNVEEMLAAGSWNPERDSKYLSTTLQQTWVSFHGSAGLAKAVEDG